jgi:hypothetical protein
MIHTVYTRQRWEHEETTIERMRLARATTIPSMVRAAKEAPHPVRWAWFTTERDQERVVDVVRRAGYPGPILTITTDGYVPLYEEDDLQSTLDSDDKVASYFLKRIQSRWRGRRSSTYIVTWQPIKERFEDGALFNHRMRYAADKPSPFYTVYNPTEKCHAYRKKHGHMHLCGAPVELLTERGAIAVIHGKNTLMDLKSGDTPLAPKRERSTAQSRRQKRRRRRGKGRRRDR